MSRVNDPPGEPAPRARGDRPVTAARRRGIFRRRPVLSTLAVLMTLAVTGATLDGYHVYLNDLGAVHHVAVTAQELGPRPPKLNGSTNILVIGSDSRAGSHGQYGNKNLITGARSDTDFILHISPDHQHVLVLSFPRDSMVPVYQCDSAGAGTSGQQAQPGQLEQLNWSYAYGGPACLWKTLEQTTRIHIDHFVQVNFSSFKRIVNDVGGVPVCLPFAIHDPASRLNLSKGQHVVMGDQALAFVRERHIGEGSDLQRIQRQQLFLAALAQKLNHSSLLSDPFRLADLVHDIAGSLTTDSGLSGTDLLGIADSLKGLNPSALQFVTVPNVPYPADQDQVWWQGVPQAAQLFSAISHDSHLPKAVAAARRGGRGGPAVAAADVRVRVLNGSGSAGVAQTAASGLTAAGFKVTHTGNAPNFRYTTSVIEYGAPSEQAEVNTLMKEIPGAQAKLAPQAGRRTLDLILGSSFKRVNPGSSSTGKSSQTLSDVANKVAKNTADDGEEVTGSADICRDSAAFTGPDVPSDFSNTGTGTTGTTPTGTTPGSVAAGN